MTGVYIILSVTVLAVAFFAGYCVISKSNRRRNGQADENAETTTVGKIINDQNGTTGKAFVYGLHSASFNACEAIAVHNAKLLLGVKSSLSETISDFQKSLAMVLYGVFGSYPAMTGRLMRKYGLCAKRVKLSEINKAGVYIVSFWNGRTVFSGLHTVALEYDGAKYTTYNLHGTGSKEQVPPSDYAKRYICGYMITRAISN